MANRLETGAAWLGKRLQAYAGRSVSIALVKDGATKSITAPVAMHEYDVADENGFLIKVQVFDWTIVAAELGDWVLGRGAQILDGAAVYEAMQLGNKPALEPLDSSGVMLTLHTKQVS